MIRSAIVVFEGIVDGYCVDVGSDGDGDGGDDGDGDGDGDGGNGSGSVVYRRREIVEGERLAILGT